MYTVQFSSFVFVFISIIGNGLADRYKIVDTENGQIRGIKSETLLNGDPFYAFKGIPYARPPIGDLRFKAPEPREPWKPAVLNAFQYSNICIQPGLMMSHPLPQSEDCLTLNIFVPGNSEQDKRFAVLFFIHGGGYLEGAGDDLFYGPDFIMEKNTILVTIQYRLGAIGFLSLNSTEYSGNMGLKDQLLALKWIHSNIHQFGGDNKRITIFGHSAGGASVNYHILSPESRKYFRNAIAMSGSVENPWALLAEKNYLREAFKMAEKLDKPQKSYDDLVKFLKDAPADSFNQFNVLNFANPVELGVAFGPIVERSDAQQPFLIDMPYDSYESLKTDVNTMFVATTHEISSLIGKPAAGYAMKGLGAGFRISLPFRKPKFPLESQENQKLVKKIRKFYFGDRSVDEQAIPQYLNLMSDFNFVWGIVKSAKTLATHSTGKTFYLLFSVDSKLNVFKNFETVKRGEMIIQPGATHGDDLCYLFRCSMALPIYDEILSEKTNEQSKISLQAIDRITKLYTNFAKYDKPSYENDLGADFQPIHGDKMHYIEFTNDGLKASINPHKDTVEFWTKIERKAHKLSENAETKKHEEL